MSNFNIRGWTVTVYESGSAKTTQEDHGIVVDYVRDKYGFQILYLRENGDLKATRIEYCRVTAPATQPYR